MLELADIFRRHGADYRARCGPRLWPVQLRAMRDIEACRTAYFGGHLKQCDHCGRQLYAYHSCRNRHCPKCHGDQTERWLAQQQTQLLPCPYFLLTFTLPAELRPLAFANQKIVYGLLLRAAAAALQKLALDWTRAMLYHPHVHMLVTGGALSAEGQEWLATRHSAFLMPEGALAVIFRAKFCAALKKAGLLQQVPRPVWKKDWVVHCKAAGQGRQVLNYLARYIFRVAISNSRLERFENGQVTFRYRDNHSQQLHRVTLPAQKFIHRFLLHVLPRGCAKVRYYGIWSPACRQQLEQARTLLSVLTTNTAAVASTPQSLPPEPAAPAPASACCPHCHLGQLLEIRLLPPQRKVPP